MAKVQQIEQDKRSLHGEQHTAERHTQEQAENNQREIYNLGEQVQRIDSGVQASLGDMAQRVQAVQGCATATRGPGPAEPQAATAGTRCRTTRCSTAPGNTGSARKLEGSFRCASVSPAARTAHGLAAKGRRGSA